MSVNLYTSDVVGHTSDRKSQRSSLQRGGFASMMELLQQNQTADIESNDTFIQPETATPEDIVAPKVAPEEVEKQQVLPQEQPTSKEIQEPVTEVLPVEKPVAEVVVPQELFVLDEVATVALEEVSQPLETPIIEQNTLEEVDNISLESDVSHVVVPLASPTPTIAIDEVPDMTAEVQTLKEAPEVIVDSIVELVEIPPEVISRVADDYDVAMPVQDIAQTIQPQVIPTKAIQNIKTEDDKKEEKTPLTIKESFIGTDRVQTEMEIEEAPEIRFVRYVEEEIETPTFQKQTSERTDVAPELLELEEGPSQPSGNVVSTTVQGVDRNVVQNMSRSEGVQASTVSEKENLKEKLQFLKKTQKKTFAQLLKQAKEKADEFKPSFHSDVLKRLEVQVRDPAGMIQMEIAQKDAVIHVKAMVPVEAIQDLHYLGQDIQDSLVDLGLELGTYELRSQNDEYEEIEEKINDDTLNEDTIIDDIDEAGMLLSDYVVDRRI